MKIYKVDEDIEKYYFLNVLRHDLYEKFNFLDKLGVGEKVSPYQVCQLGYFIDVDNGVDKELGDFIGNTTGLVFTEKVFNSPLQNFFDTSGQVIQLDMREDKNFPGIECWLHNITTVVDCLNEEESSCEYMPSGAIYDIEKYVFKEEKIPKGTSLFRIPQWKKTNTMLVTGIDSPENDFYFMYHKLGFTGLKFTEIYRSEGEEDYDMEATLKEMEIRENIEKPIFKK